MIKEYLDELEELKNKMEKAEKFADKFPCFKDYILKNKITGESNSISFGEKYKDLRLQWGINRYYYKTSDNITNYNKEYKGFLFNLYFNTLSIYGSHNNYGIEKLKYIKGVLFFDELNTTFYIQDEGISEFLEEANKWYNESIILLKEENKIKREKQLLIELEQLRKN